MYAYGVGRAGVRDPASTFPVAMKRGKWPAAGHVVTETSVHTRPAVVWVMCVVGGQLRMPCQSWHTIHTHSWKSVTGKESILGPFTSGQGILAAPGCRSRT